MFLLTLFITQTLALVGDECIHFSYFRNCYQTQINLVVFELESIIINSGLTGAYADGICSNANNWAEWIYLPNAFGDRTFEQLQQRLFKLEGTSGLSNQRKERICYFIFPSCKSNQEVSEIQIGQKVDKGSA